MPDGSVLYTMAKPFYKLIIEYDIIASSQEDYFRFVTGEMVPRLQGLGLHMFRVYQTEYGEYPLRRLEFAIDSLETARSALNSKTWEELKESLEKYVFNYSQRLVVFQESFQV
jgi:hypothetical protein